MIHPGGKQRSARAYVWLLFIVLSLVGCSMVEADMGSTSTPSRTAPAVPAATATVTPLPMTQVMPQIIPAPSPMPVAPWPGMVYRTAGGLWWVDASGKPAHLFERADALLSPDGTRALYLEKDAGDLGLWLADLVTGERRNLTGTPDRVEGSFRWWPERPGVILFSSLPRAVSPGPGENGFLTAVGIDGTSSVQDGICRVLDTENHTSGPPAPSPDGWTIAYGSGDTAWLYHWGKGPEVFDPGDYGLTTVRDLHIGSPAWSPDGSKLAWVLGGHLTAGTEYQMAVGVFDLASQTAEVLLAHEPVWGDGWPAAPVWSPDGRWLAFVTWAQDPDKAGLWIVAADGQQDEVHHLGGSHPVWSPDGRWLAFSHAPQNGEHASWVAEVGSWATLKTRLPSGATVEAWFEEDLNQLAFRGRSADATPTPSAHMDVWVTYSNPTFGISLEYPSDWKPIPGYGGPDDVPARYGAINGFFHVNAKDADDLDAAAAAEAEHRLEPYGSEPTIESLQVQGQDARLILPSEDQAAGMGYQAALIVRYPQPVTLTGSACRFFLLWADKSHIRVFAQTLRFNPDVAAPETATLTPPTALPAPLYFLPEGPSESGHLPGVWRLDPGSMQVERITPHDLHVTSFDLWLHDGRMAYGTHDGKLFVVMPGREPLLLHDASLRSDDAVEIEGLAWSPDGTRLAYTVRYRGQSAIFRGDTAGDADGLWLLTLDGAMNAKLLGNRRMRQEGDKLDVGGLRLVSNPLWSPDGSALMLRGSYWEWSDILWLDPITSDPEEKNLHDPPGAWTDGSWADGGQSILLSGADRACYSDLLRIWRESGTGEQLIDGHVEGLAVFKAQELPAGITFLTFQDCDAQKPRLYLGHQSDAGFSRTPAGPGGDLCSSDQARDVVWDPTGRWGVLSCSHEFRLISLDGTDNADLTPFLGPLAGHNAQVLWGKI